MSTWSHTGVWHLIICNSSFPIPSLASLSWDHHIFSFPYFSHTLSFYFYFNFFFEGFTNVLICPFPYLSWFHGRISREQSESILLAATTNGAFLFRESWSTPGRLSLGVQLQQLSSSFCELLHESYTNLTLLETSYKCFIIVLFSETNIMSIAFEGFINCVYVSTYVCIIFNF